MSIESVALAFKRKTLPKKNFTVSFSESDYYSIDVVARDEDEARELAWEEQSNGNYDGGCNTNTDIDDVQEGDIVEEEEEETDDQVEPADASEVAAHSLNTV